MERMALKRRIFNTISLISAVLLVCTISLGTWSFWTDPRTDCLSMGDEFHVAVQYGRVSFFNVKNYGPYHGSIISLSSSKDSADGVFAVRRGFGDACGIYYRYFRWAESGDVLWTLSVSLVYPLILFAVLPTVWTLRRWRAGRLRGDHEEMHGPRQQNAHSYRPVLVDGRPGRRRVLDYCNHYLPDVRHSGGVSLNGKCRGNCKLLLLCGRVRKPRSTLPTDSRPNQTACCLMREWWQSCWRPYGSRF